MFEQLSQVAPTYAAANAGREDWEVLLADLGTLTGRSGEVQGVIDDVDSRYAQLREEYPDLQGGTVSFVAYFAEQEFAFGDSGWLQGLGLEPETSEDSVGNLNTAGRLSLENVEDLEADVLVVQPIGEGLQQQLEDDPRFGELPASRNNAVLFIDTQTAVATSMPSRTACSGPSISCRATWTRSI